MKHKKILYVLLLVAILAIAMLTANVIRTHREAGHMVKDISAGFWTSFAIDSNGQLWAWGNNFAGQLGDGTATDRHRPVRIMRNMVYISAASSHAMAIRNDGSLWGWGSNRNGQIGDINSIDQDVHRPIKIMEDVVAVSTGDMHTMAIKSDGSLWGWGSNRNGARGDGTNRGRHNSVKIMDDVVAVSAGSNHTMAIQSDGSLWAWGSNRFGQLGDGSITQFEPEGGDRVRLTPVKVMDDVVAVSAGSNHTAAIRSDGSLWTWGQNTFGNLGDGTTDDRFVPVKVLEGVIAVSVGTRNTMAIKIDGSLWGWGSNSDGQLGDGSRQGHTSPVKIMDNVAAVEAGRIGIVLGRSSLHTMAITTDGALWTWGGNGSGQLGDGTTENRHSPVMIMEGAQVR